MKIFCIFAYSLIIQQLKSQASKQMDMSFGEKIRQLREEKQLLQRQLAAVLEIDTLMYSKYNAATVVPSASKYLFLLTYCKPTQLSCLPFGWQTR
jgi:DNA-binding transcriptional regulator YiaG